jgi:hypothetical protein
MASSGSTALQSDYNNPQGTANSLWKVGSGDTGYGQVSTFSSQVDSTTTMGTNEWNNLRYDLFNIRAHQIGTNPAISVAAASGNNIVATDATNFASYASQYNTDRLTAHSSRISTGAIFWADGYGFSTRTRSASWYASVQVEFFQSFPNANPTEVLRHFYNTGGTVRLTSSRTGGDATAQNTSWTNLLSGAGTYVFNASELYSKLYYASTGYQTLFSANSSSPYATNQYLIEGKLVAEKLYFRITYIDPYVDPPSGEGPLGIPAEVGPEDLVNGTLTLLLDHQYATGGAALAGGGYFKGFGTAYNGNYSLPGYSLLNNMTGG